MCKIAVLLCPRFFVLFVLPFVLVFGLFNSHAHAHTCEPWGFTVYQGACHPSSTWDNFFNLCQKRGVTSDHGGNSQYVLKTGTGSNPVAAAALSNSFTAEHANIIFTTRHLEERHFSIDWSYQPTEAEGSCYFSYTVVARPALSTGAGATTSGTTTSATFTGGVVDSNGQITSTTTTGSSVNIAGAITPDPGDWGQLVDSLVVAGIIVPNNKKNITSQENEVSQSFSAEGLSVAAAAETTWYQKTASGWQTWDGSIGNLQMLESDVTVSEGSTLNISIFDGSGLPSGTLNIFMGYRRGDGTVVYSLSPINLTVQ
jgi:hypothetical protein